LLTTQVNEQLVTRRIRWREEEKNISIHYGTKVWLVGGVQEAPHRRSRGSEGISGGLARALHKGSSLDSTSIKLLPARKLA
jgi:hypothetical protein